MQLSWLKEHLGVTITIVGAGIGTAIWRGSGLLPILIGMVATLAVLSIFGSRKASSEQSEKESKAIASGPLSFSYSWQLSGPPDLSELEEELRARGLELDQSSSSDSKRLFRRGSQLRTRLLGGYFVNPRFLPLQVEVETKHDSGECWKLNVCAQDTLGVALRDSALRKRYALSASEIEGVVEEGLRRERA